VASKTARAVVFAYHNVGVRCLRVLAAHGVDIALVVTHQDNPQENIWFESIAQVAGELGVPVATPEDPNTPEFVARLQALDGDFFFSFYYRLMLKPVLLALPKRGAYNMHGSLLPKYRGRVPINWAIIHGEQETGATLHRMVEKPDAGEIVAQQSVPILPDDTAGEVFDKVTVAAASVLDKILPQLIAGTAPHVMPDLTKGSYFGGRKPEDGRIDWNRPALEIHNLIRAVAPPYPGAFTNISGHPVRMLRSRLMPGFASRHLSPTIYRSDDMVLADCADGRVLRILEWEGEWDASPCRLTT
jgi:methionyl-tRNA formyltransferase